MKHIDIKQIFTDESFVGQQVVVCGWIRTSRDSKNMAFLEINDGTTLKHLQIVIDKQNFESTSEFMRLGTAVKVTGTVVPAAKSGSVEINAEEIVVLGECPLDYPLQKKRHSLEFLRTMPHLRVRTNTFNAVFRVRSVVADTIHRFFQDRGFVYVNTPLITGSDCEGAGEVFKVTTIGYSNDYKTEDEYYADDFFGCRAGLSVSGQLEGEVAAMAFGKIYTFGPSFRAENSNTPRHVAEFWHVEPEVAFAELPDIIELAEEMIKYIIKTVLERCPDELAFFDQHFEKGLIEKLEGVVNSDFVILEYTKAIELLKEADVEFVYPVEWGNDLQTEHEKYITEQVFKKPVFVINYPKDIKSFYMKQNPDGKTVA
ncbi:MAG: asparagine--tRNA ligase, partial [Clostridia bacterium]|nr:asparagine--tRNA ligase [Clostridia bacterium]